jgi:hypothetical protein
MPIKIGDGIMRLEIDGRVVATATERAGGWWQVAGLLLAAVLRR